MSDDIVERLREYAEEWQVDRSVVDRAADEIIRLRALVEASVVLAQPGALTVNCVRGTVTCQETERLRARVAVLEGARIRPIRTDADHKAALARIDALMDAAAGTPEAEELDVLADLVEHYEEKHVPEVKL